MDNDKKKVIIDACTIIYFYDFDSINGLKNLVTYLKLLNYEPYICEYVLNNELCDDNIKNFCKTEFKVLYFENFLYKDCKKQIYYRNFLDLYDDFFDCGTQNKQKVSNIDSSSIFNRCPGSNFGDIHTILVADEYNMDILLSDDIDLPIYKELIKRKISLDFDIVCLNSFDLIKLADNTGSTNIDTSTSIKNFIISSRKK